MGLLRVLVQNKTLSSAQAGRYQQALKDNKVMSELGDVLLRAKIQHFLWQKGKTIYF